MKIGGYTRFTLALVFPGYLGAAIFYSGLIGVNLQFPYACPVCPHIDRLESPLSKFVHRTLALGTLNAALFTAVGWLIAGVVRLTRRIVSH